MTRRDTSTVDSGQRDFSALLGRWLLLAAMLMGGTATEAVPPASSRLAPDDLIDEDTRQRLTAYLDDICQWTMTLDVGSGTLKNTKDTATSIFINGNFARLLMASQTISPNKARLDEALRWCDGFCAQQEKTTTSKGEPAGFWSDLGPGRNIYFGDGGTAATALAIGYRVADDARKRKYLEVMENMARFVMHGSTSDPQGKNREATRSFVISEGPDRGALGCGYYAGHLSMKPYTISTATTGGAFFATLYAIKPQPEYREIATGATKWLLKIRKPDGEIPYTLDGKVEAVWPLDTLSYCTEAFMAVDMHFKDQEVRALLQRELRPTIQWLIAGQNPDGSWGKMRSPDQQRSPRAVSLLAWYYRTVEREPKVAEAVQRYCRFLLDPANSKAYGVKDLVRTTGFVGLTVAEIISPGSSF
jgi:hypothetical protein